MLVYSVGPNTVAIRDFEAFHRAINSQLPFGYREVAASVLQIQRDNRITRVKFRIWPELEVYFTPDGYYAGKSGHVEIIRIMQRLRSRRVANGMYRGPRPMKVGRSIQGWYAKHVEKRLTHYALIDEFGLITLIISSNY